MNVDVLNKEQCHKAIGHIKSKDISIKLALRKELWANGYQYMILCQDLAQNKMRSSAS